MYTLLAALVVIAAFAWRQLITRPTRAAWVALWLAEIAILYAHNSGPVVMLWLNVATLAYWLSRRSIVRPVWRVWILGQIGVGIVWLPYFLTRFVLLADANAAVSAAPPVTGEFLLGVWRSLWVTPWERVVLTMDGASFSAALLIGGIVIALVGRRGGGWIVHSVILTGGLIAALIVLGNEFHSRYLVMIAPVALIGLSGALAAVRPRWAALGLVSAFIGMSVLNLMAQRDSVFRHDDARGMVAYYADQLTASDSVLAWSYADRYDLAYYWDRLGVTAARVTLPEGAGYEAIAPLLPPTGAVAANIWYTQRADYRGMLACLLAHGRSRSPEEFTTYGMTTRVYRGEGAGLPVWSSMAAVFTRLDGQPVARLDASGDVQPLMADQYQCVPLRLTLLTPLADDLRAAVLVRDAAGSLLYETDAIFAAPDQQTTRTLSVGAVAEAYPIIRLPFGAPPGTYSIYLRLYAAGGDVSGFAPPTAGTTVGRDWLLGDWIVPMGADWTASDRAAEIPTRLADPDTIAVGERRLIGFRLPASTEPLTNGTALSVVLYWDGRDDLPPLILRDEQDAWTLTVPPSIVDPPLGIIRDARTTTLPATAATGTGVLETPDGHRIGRWPVSALPLLTEPPADMIPLVPPADFPGVGAVIGMLPTVVPGTVTLVWRAAGDTAASYTVFVQDLGAAGTVLAQSDTLPAFGSRPTTSWRAGEIIVDQHTLRTPDGQSPNDSAGVTRIVGLYDALTSRRVQRVDGSDFAVLAVSPTAP